MNAKAISQILTPGRTPSPFWRRITVGLAALTLCLTGFILPARGQDPRLTLTIHPMDTNVSVGAAVSFRVYASTANPPLTFQWQHNNVDIPRATNYSLTLPTVTAADAGGYKAIVWNAIGNSTNSRTATLTVDPTFTKITQGPMVTENLDDHAVAWGDYDGDGDQDVVLSGGYWGSGSTISSLYTNRGDGSFTKAVPSPFGSSAEGLCVNWADADNDGDLDLWLGVNETYYPQFFTNRGNATFTRTLVTPTWITNGVNVRGGMQAWADYDGDGLLDLAVVPFGNDPATRKPLTLLHNSGNGRFAAVTNSPFYEVNKYSTSASWVDLDDDGDPDLICLGDSPRGFRNQGGTLSPMPPTELPSIAGAKVDAWADFDNDGDLDVLGTVNNGAPVLYRNDSHGRWTSLQGPLYDAFQGIGSSTEANSAAWGDYDNDGDLDLFVVAGVEGETNRNHLFRNDGAAGFVEVFNGSTVNDRARSHQCVWVDYDNDGDLDLHVLNSINGVNTANDINDFLYRNNGGTNHWLEVKLSGRVSNRSAIGAKVRIKVVIGGKETWQLRTISAQAWTQELVAHFGLGDAARAEILRIEWPSGIVQETTSVAANQILSLEEEPFLVTSSVPEIKPGRVDVSKGEAVTLGVSATPATATYQWQFNGQDIPGAVTATLSIPSLSARDLGRYTVLVTTADLRVYARPVDLGMLGRPVISGPYATTPHSISLGAPVVLHADVTGATPLVLLWQLNGVDIPATLNPTAATSELRIEAATLADEGAYRLVASNPVDTVFSTTVSIQVDPTFTKVMTGVIVTDAEASITGNWADYDNDSYPDLYVANVGNGSRGTLYHNDGGTNFSRVTTSPVSTDVMTAWFAAWADYDNDGNVDLIAANLNGGTFAQRLYRNIGDGSFVAVVDSALRSDPSVATCPWWLDYDNDGFVDLFVAKGFAESVSSDCLFRNNGDGTFQKMTTADVGWMLSDRVGSDFCFSVDFDNDGRQELTVYHSIPMDGGGYNYTNFTWDSQANGSFVTSPIAIPYGAVSWGDYDNDGRLDTFANIFGQLGLVRNLGALGFTYATEALNWTTRMEPAVPAWGDYDNDGWLDLFFTGAHWLGELNGLFHNNGDGTFTQILSGSPVYDADRRWAPAWVDCDNDGSLDLFIAVGDGMPRKNLLYRNNGNTNHWLKVKLDGKVSNRSGIGAKVRAQATINGRTFWQVREISCGSGQGGPSGLTAHFGLGDATNVTTLQIQWPSGIVQELSNVSANQFITVAEHQDYTGVSPSFARVTNSSAGVQLSITEPAATARYILEASTDLVSWTKLMARTSVGDAAQFADTRATNYTSRFYRLQVP